jgi:hypothetical protein
MKDRDQEGYYSLLGVGPEATPAEIKAAYQAALAAADGPGLEFVKKAAEQAYAVLGDATARQAYDPAWSHTVESTGSSAGAGSLGAAGLGGADKGSSAERPAAPQRAWVGSEDDASEEPAVRPTRVFNQVGYEKFRDPQGYYMILGVSPDASHEVIGSAYRAFRSSVSLSAEQQAALQVAFNVLGDPVLRVRYDPSYMFFLQHQALLRKGLGFDLEGLGASSRTSSPSSPNGRAWVGSEDDVEENPTVRPYGQQAQFTPAHNSKGCLGVVICLLIFGLGFFLK